MLDNPPTQTNWGYPMLESELLQRRALLDRYLGKGLIISVSWTKKDGTLAKR